MFQNDMPPQRKEKIDGKNITKLPQDKQITKYELLNYYMH